MKILVNIENSKEKISPFSFFINEMCVFSNWIIQEDLNEKDIKNLWPKDETILNCKNKLKYVLNNRSFVNNIIVVNLKECE